MTAAQPQPQPNALAEAAQPLRQVEAEVGKVLVGQRELVRRLLIGLLCDAHLLLEGVPGLAKTTVVKTLAAACQAQFRRIQFTPDLLPADIIGTRIYEAGTFATRKGPIFAQVVLADEINRAPAKVQSALLEAMAERQITVGRSTWRLPELFLVMATQNPIEQEGTFALPEAQLDRFVMHVTIGYPDAAAELAILKLARSQASRHAQAHAAPRSLLTRADVMEAREAVLAVHMAPALEEYLTQLVLATRDAGRYGAELARWIAWGGSPRATIALDRCARAHAWLDGRDYALPEDVHAVAHEVLRHRVLLSYEAEAEGVRPDQVIDRLLDLVPLP
ncbi:MoxR family ATPase [Dyella sp.]|uniref:AAA family ATPase n=1 Tax=Dyella sp. TaxID=1869338 RepID=UPI002D773265|nr:MoxR family ATPase [Dyella sp.]HET6431578.1 MoxR family ATPase [Dyella sp.]